MTAPSSHHVRRDGTESRPAGVLLTGGEDPLAGSTAGAVSFEVARLELDELLIQLVARAQDVITTRDHLKGLLLATRRVTAELALPVVLRQIVESARALVDASYATLGVVGGGSGRARFVHDGKAPQTVSGTDAAPWGAGVLDALIETPRLLRLVDVHEHPTSFGLPGHPPLHSFLAVPIRIKDEVFGSLCLTDKAGGGQFTGEDEELVTVLAATAGAAIENARLFEEVSRRQRWQEASARITTALLSAPDSPDALILVMTEGRRLVDADDATITRSGPQREEDLEVVAAVGEAVGRLAGTTMTLRGSVTELVRTLGPVAFRDVQTDGRVPPDCTPHPGLGPVIAVPLTSADRPKLVLMLARAGGREPFTDSDIDLIAHFGEHVALALNLAQARADSERLRVFEDRDRIARDMHDHVIGRLFGAGMSAHGLARWIVDPAGRRKLAGLVDDLDAVVRDIRTSIYALDHDAEQVWGLPARVQQVISEAIGYLGFAPDVRIDSGIDLPAKSLTADHLLAVLREALANVARHAGATTAQVTVTAGPTLDLIIIDNGRGIPEERGGRTASGGNGLVNMAERAADLGGTFAITPGPAGGTRLHWSAPMASDRTG